MEIKKIIEKLKEEMGKMFFYNRKTGIRIENVKVYNKIDKIFKDEIKRDYCGQCGNYLEDEKICDYCEDYI